MGTFHLHNRINEWAYNIHIKATGSEYILVSFPLVHQSKDADNDRVTVVVFAVNVFASFVLVVVDDDDDAAAADDDDEYGLFINKYIQYPHQPLLQGRRSTSSQLCLHG